MPLYMRYIFPEFFLDKTFQERNIFEDDDGHDTIRRSYVNIFAFFFAI